VPVPEQAPVQPANPLPGLGATVSVRLVPCAKLALHPVAAATPLVMTQPLMPLGELLTVPLPVPPPTMVMGCRTTWPKFAITDFAPSSAGKMQVLMPLHAPPHPVKLLAPLAVAVSVTVTPGLKLAEHDPSTLPPWMVQLMPAGALVTTPLPVAPPGPTEIVKVFGAKDAVTARLPFIVSAHDPVPVQDPAQPLKD